MYMFVGLLVRVYVCTACVGVYDVHAVLVRSCPLIVYTVLRKLICTLVRVHVYTLMTCTHIIVLIDLMMHEKR